MAVTTVYDSLLWLTDEYIFFLLQEVGTNSVVQMSDGSVKVKSSLCSMPAGNMSAQNRALVLIHFYYIPQGLQASCELCGGPWKSQHTVRSPLPNGCNRVLVSSATTARTWSTGSWPISPCKVSWTVVLLVEQSLKYQTFSDHFLTLCKQKFLDPLCDHLLNHISCSALVG